MNLGKKKILAAKALNVGKDRIIFVRSRLDEIKEAITKQDIKDLHQEGAIIIKEIKGRKKIINKKKKKSPGNIRIKVRQRKKEYIILTRKLKRNVEGLKKQGRLSDDKVKDLKNKIKNRFFKNKSHLNEYIRMLK